MTNYSNGFFRKCAEYRVPYGMAVAMYKAATGTNTVSAAEKAMYDSPPSGVAQATNSQRAASMLAAIKRYEERQKRRTGGVKPPKPADTPHPGMNR